MSDELKPCPFCGKEMTMNNFFSCDGYPQACGCWEKTTSGDASLSVWNTRPIEDALQACIDALEAENAELKEAQAWHPASEPPDCDKFVLVAKKVKGRKYWLAEELYLSDGGFDDIVTHWRELPKPPEEKAE